MMLINFNATPIELWARWDDHLQYFIDVSLELRFSSYISNSVKVPFTQISPWNYFKIRMYIDIFIIGQSNMNSTLKPQHTFFIMIC